MKDNNLRGFPSAFTDIVSTANYCKTNAASSSRIQFALAKRGRRSRQTTHRTTDWLVSGICVNVGIRLDTLRPYARVSVIGASIIKRCRPASPRVGGGGIHGSTSIQKALSRFVAFLRFFKQEAYRVFR